MRATLSAQHASSHNGARPMGRPDVRSRARQWRRPVQTRGLFGRHCETGQFNPITEWNVRRIWGGQCWKGVLLFSHHHAYSVWGEGSSHIEVWARKPITCGFISMQISSRVDLYFKILLQKSEPANFIVPITFSTVCRVLYWNCICTSLKKNRVTD